MKELIWRGNEPGHRVQLHLCKASGTCLKRDSHTWKDSAAWWTFRPGPSIILIISELAEKFNNQHVTPPQPMFHSLTSQEQTCKTPFCFPTCMDLFKQRLIFLITYSREDRWAQISLRQMETTTSERIPDNFHVKYCRTFTLPLGKTGF